MQEACEKGFAVHLLKFEILQQPHEKTTKSHQNARSIGEKLRTKGLIILCFIFSCDFQDFKF